VVGFCEHGNETLGFIKGGRFVGYVGDYHLLKSVFHGVG
jgi:hypothetical protein